MCTNTYFQNKSAHRVSWMHPRSHQWQQLDLVITSRMNLQSVQNTKTYLLTVIQIIHVSSVKLQSNQRGSTRPSRKTNPRPTLQQQQTLGEHNNSPPLSNNIPPLKPDETAETRWSFLSFALHESAIESYGENNVAMLIGTMQTSLQWNQQLRLREKLF